MTPETLNYLRRHNFLKPLARAEAIEQSVEKITIEENECNNIWTTYCKQNNITNDEELKSHLEQKMMSISDLKWNLELNLRISKFSRENFLHKAEAHFLERKESLDRIVYSLLRVQNAFIARELYLRIAGNEANFADLAAEYSLGNEAKTKGVVGPVPMTQPHPLLSEKLRTSMPGELLEPFQINEWWLVVRLERYEPAKFNNSTAQAIVEELFRIWIEEKALFKLDSLQLGLSN